MKTTTITTIVTMLAAVLMVRLVDWLVPDPAAGRTRLIVSTGVGLAAGLVVWFFRRRREHLGKRAGGYGNNRPA